MKFSGSDDWNHNCCVLTSGVNTHFGVQGDVVEEGKQVVLWEQYNATWYIRGCVSYPATPKSHA